MSKVQEEVKSFMEKAVTWKRGNQYEDFEMGQIFEHHWGRTINSGDNSLFGSLTLHYSPLYFNAAYAKKMGHDKIPVNSLLVFNTVFGLSVEDLSEGGNGPFLGVDDLEYHATVYEGDTLTCKSEVIAKRTSEKIKTHGIVSWRTQGYNQHGDLVLTFKRSNLVTFRANINGNADSIFKKSKS